MTETPGRRELTRVVLSCAAAAGVVLFASSRTWLVEHTQRPAPLPAATVTHTGAELLPLLPALAWVGLAGAVALLATRGAGRIAVGVLLGLAGLGVTIAAAHDATTRPGVAFGWALLCAVAGAILAVVGMATVRRSRAWPGMSARYDRTPAANAANPATPAPHSTASERDPAGYAAGWWDAIERGEDPTTDE